MSPEILTATGTVLIWASSATASAILGDAAAQAIGSGGGLGYWSLGSLINSFGVIGALVWVIWRADKREQQIESRYAILLAEHQRVTTDCAAAIKTSEVAIRDAANVMSKLTDRVNDSHQSVQFCKAMWQAKGGEK